MKMLTYSDIIANAILLKNTGVGLTDIINIPFIAKTTCNLHIKDGKKTLSYSIIEGKAGVINITLGSILKEGLKNLTYYISFYKEEDEVKKEVKEKTETINKVKDEVKKTVKEKKTKKNTKK